MVIKCNIPVIDLEDFPAQSSKLVQAGEEWGCFRLVNHHNILSVTLMSEMKSVAQSLQDFPPEIKLQNTGIIPGSGYITPSQANPLYEAFGLYMSCPEDVNVFCSQLNASPSQRETIFKYTKAVHELLVEISGKLADGLGISGFTIEGWPCLFRINKFNFAKGTIGSSGFQIHTDSGFLTIVQDDEGVSGLEVMDQSGAFMPIDPWPGALVVNLGDVAKAWSNGRLRSVKHRVQCKEGRLRYSIAAFLGPNETVEAPPELVDDAHPRFIPVIDLQDFPAQTSKLVQVCQEWGCFRLINHQNILSNSLMSEMKSVVKSLFDLPPETKRRNTDVIAGSGYVAPSQTNPLYEAFGLFISSQQHVDAFCSQLNASPYQRETLIKYAKAIHELFVQISGKLADGLGLSNFTIEGWPFQFRINKYNFAEETVGSSGVQIHTDSGFLTILQDDEGVGGLEVMDTTGAFLPVDPWPNTLVVNLGDVATAWSNGRLRTVKHRVQCKEANLRYSIAAFLLGPKETVEAPAELVDAAHPRLYAPFTFEDYRKLRLSTKLQAGEALDLLLIDS